MRRTAVAAVVTALVSLTAAPVAAHPGPVDADGGHICRPTGSGASECTRLGLEVGEYHCQQEPCFSKFRRTGRTWCNHGLPVPVRSDGIGVFPVGDFTPPIRVERLGGPGHVLEVDRAIEPKVQAPRDCLGDRAVLRPDEGLGPQDDAGFQGAESVRAASAEVVPLDPGLPGGTPYAPAAFLVAALALLASAGRRRPRVYWEAPRG